MLQTITEVRAAYSGEDVAASYVDKRFTSALTALLHERQVQEVNRTFARCAPSAALELAPGPGRITRHVHTAGKLICVEYNQCMIDVAKKARACPAQWIRGDGFALPLDCRFDLVYSFRFIRHFRRADRDRLYAEIRRVLTPGGILLMDAVNRTVSEPLRRSNPRDYTVYDKLYEGTSELEVELTDSGFELVSATPVQRFFSAQSRVQNIVGPRWPRLCRKLIKILESVRQGPALEWIVTCRRV